MANCPNCGNETGKGAVFCDQCGARIAAPETATAEPAPTPAGGSVICPACGAGNVPGEAFCDYCGSPLEAPLPTSEPAPEAEAEPEAVEEAVAEVEAAALVGAEALLEEESLVGAEPVEEEVVVAGVEAAPAEAEAAPVEAGGGITCPACGAQAQPDEAFCADCGASLAKEPLPPEPVPVAEEPVAETPAEAPAAEAAPEQPAEAPPAAAAEDAPPAEPAAEEPPAPPPGPPTCPVCGTKVEEGDTFCSGCGAVLKEVPPTPADTPAAETAVAPAAEAAPAPAPSPSGPRLVVSSSGAEIPIPEGDEILIGREDPVSGVYPGIDLTPHGGEEGGVSRRHARFIVEGGVYQVEDLDSTNFTFVNKQKLAAKTRHTLNDGDELRCGRVALVFKI